MKGKKIKVVYAEPADYFPEELRRKYKLGEFAEPKEEEAKPSPAEYDRWGKVGVRFTDEPVKSNNTWIISANINVYDYVSAFATNGFVNWRHRVKFNEGDIVYIYCSKGLRKEKQKGIHKVKYKCVVLNHSMPFSPDEVVFWKDLNELEKAKSMHFARLKLLQEVDTERLSLDVLIANGLKKAPQGPQKINEELQSYIENCFNDFNG